MLSSTSSNNAMLIFDWDDTILPSSFVDKAQADNLKELPAQYHSLFREIEVCTEKCLAAAAKHGEVRMCCIAIIDLSCEHPPNFCTNIYFISTGGHNHKLR